MPEPNTGTETNFWIKLWNKLQDYLVTFVIVTLLGGCLTIFSDSITSKIKFSIYRTDQQVTQYENISKSLSKYVFAVEYVHESYNNGSATTIKTIKTVKCSSLSAHSFTPAEGNKR